MLKYNIKALVKTFVKTQGKITYNRQAFYFFCMKSGLDRGQVVKMIKEATQAAKLPYNSGIICKESKAAEALLNRSFLCNIYDKGTEAGFASEKIVQSIAESMQSRALNYNTLFGNNDEKPKAKSKAERIIDFVNGLNKKDIAALEKAIEKRKALFKRLEAEKAKDKAAAAKAEKQAEKQAKATKAKQAKAAKAKAKQAEKAKAKAKAEKAKAALALPKQQSKARRLFNEATAAIATAAKAQKAAKTKAEKQAAAKQAEKAKAKAAKAQKAAKQAKATAAKAA